MLKITNLHVSIDETPILQGLSLEAAPGTIHALMGPNGSGKSTLSYTLMGHPRYQVISGDIEVRGSSIVSLSPDKRAKLGLFLAHQQPLEIPGVRIRTLLKEAHQAITGIAMPVAEFNELLTLCLKQVNLDPSCAERAINEGFSGGEKKRLELLQILILKPSIVILDEIDSGLDIDALAIVADTIAHLKQANPNLIVLVITHYQRILDHLIPDYVHIVSGGRIVQSGNKELAAEIERKGYHGLIN